MDENDVFFMRFICGLLIFPCFVGLYNEIPADGCYGVAVCGNCLMIELLPCRFAVYWPASQQLCLCVMMSSTISSVWFIVSEPMRVRLCMD